MPVRLICVEPAEWPKHLTRPRSMRAKRGKDQQKRQSRKEAWKARREQYLRLKMNP